MAKSRHGVCLRMICASNWIAGQYPLFEPTSKQRKAACDDVHTDTRFLNHCSANIGNQHPGNDARERAQSLSRMPVFSQAKLGSCSGLLVYAGVHVLPFAKPGRASRCLNHPFFGQVTSISRFRKPTL